MGRSKFRRMMVIMSLGSWRCPKRLPTIHPLPCHPGRNDRERCLTTNRERNGVHPSVYTPRVPAGRPTIAHDFNRGFPHSKPTSPVGTADAALHSLTHQALTFFHASLSSFAYFEYFAVQNHPAQSLSLFLHNALGFLLLGFLSLSPAAQQTSVRKSCVGC